MITNERITAYLNSLEPDGEPLLDEIYRKAVCGHVPVIKKETAALLRTMIVLKKPRTILEAGTAVGYSALLMAKAAPPGAHVTTIEKFAKRIPIARENFRLAGAEGQITLLEGDAGEILERLSGSFDFIFLDAAKGQYPAWLPKLLRLLAPGGLLMTDNVLQEGTIAESRYAVERRDRTIHARMREYLYTLKHTDGLVTAVLPVGDGVALSVKTEESDRAEGNDETQGNGETQGNDETERSDGREI